MTRELSFHLAARAALVRGAQKLARAVSCTLGPGGRVVLIDDRFGRVIATRDGVTVARAIVLEDAAENMGARMLADAALKVAELHGDGTTTTVVVAADLLARCTQLVIAGHDPCLLAAQLQRAGAQAIDALYRNTLAFTTIEPEQQKLMTRLVASVACKGDKRVIDAVIEAFDHVGTSGAILLKEGDAPFVQVLRENGYRLDRGWIDPAVGPRDAGLRLVLENCAILATTRPIQNGAELLPVMRHCADEGLSLLIVTPALDDTAMSTLAGNIKSGALLASAIRAPGFGDHQWQNLHDLALFTGGRVQDVEDVFQADGLGFAAKVEMTRERAFVTQAGGDQAQIDQRITYLESQRKTERNDYDKDKLGERLGRLRGRIAEIHAGAPTPAEAVEIKFRIEDAVSAVRSAFQDGVQPGGGIALLRAAHEVCDATPGAVALQAAMEAPARKIATNYGTAPHHVIASANGHPGSTWATGADATGKTCNMLAYPDPTAVVVGALSAAVSTVATLLLAETTVTLREEDQ